MSGGIEITRAALHELLTDAHVAIVEHRHDWAGAVLHALRKLTGPGVVEPQGRARKLKDEISLPGGLGLGSPSAAEAVPQPPTPEPAQAAGGKPRAKLKLKRQMGEWTSERDALLASRYPSEGARPEVMAALNALPGRPFTSVGALHRRAHDKGLRLSRDAHKRAVMAGMARAKGGQPAQETTPRPAPELPRAKPGKKPDVRLAAAPAIAMRGGRMLNERAQAEQTPRGKDAMEVPVIRPATLEEDDLREGDEAILARGWNAPKVAEWFGISIEAAADWCRTLREARATAADVAAATSAAEAAT